VLEVAGQRLRLSGPADQAHLERLAKVVNDRFEALQRSGRGASPAQMLAMVALNLADDALTERERADAAAEDLRRATERADARGREVELAARRAIADAIATIDRALVSDDELAALERAKSSA
jgi:cell division protein ZapA (FtsZ GTPase activity inhibitor)